MADTTLPERVQAILRSDLNDSSTHVLEGLLVSKVDIPSLRRIWAARAEAARGRGDVGIELKANSVLSLLKDQTSDGIHLYTWHEKSLAILYSGADNTALVISDRPFKGRSSL